MPVITNIEDLRVLARKVCCKLEKDPDAPEFVLTEPRLGYRLVDAVPQELERGLDPVLVADPHVRPVNVGDSRTRLEHRLAVLAFPKEDTGVRRHFFGLLVAAFGASQCRLNSFLHLIAETPPRQE